MKIAVVILHYRNVTDTLECLQSLERQDYPHFTVILVNNGSQDAVALLNAVQAMPRVELIHNTQNLGFAEGNNVGISKALSDNAESILLLNNDTVVAPNLLTTFAQAASENPQAGAFGAKIFSYDEPTQIWHAGGNISASYRCYHEGCLDSALDKQWDQMRPIQYACGCALFVTAQAIDKVGLMDPQFFLIWEEIDWCTRMQKQGLLCLYVPSAHVWHKISQSFEGGNRGPQWQYYYFRNRLLFLKRHVPWKKRIAFYTGCFVKELFQILWFSIAPTSREKKLNRAALKGIVDFFLGKFHRGY